MPDTCSVDEDDAGRESEHHPVVPSSAGSASPAVGNAAQAESEQDEFGAAGGVDCAGDRVAGDDFAVGSTGGAADDAASEVVPASRTPERHRNTSKWPILVLVTIRHNRVSSWYYPSSAHIEEIQYPYTKLKSETN